MKHLFPKCSLILYYCTPAKKQEVEALQRLSKIAWIAKIFPFLFFLHGFGSSGVYFETPFGVKRRVKAGLTGFFGFINPEHFVSTKVSLNKLQRFDFAFIYLGRSKSTIISWAILILQLWVYFSTLEASMELI